jgi:uncharacterized peroxidase-related enzyme
MEMNSGDQLMKIFPSLTDEPSLGEVYRRFPNTLPPLLDYHDRLLRDPSPLTVAQRELIAAYVSGLNACVFCHGAHIQAAEAYGVDPGLFAALMSDVDSAPVDDPMKPLLRYVRKLTLTPSRIVPSDAAAVFAAGWDEQALFDAISVCALFNFMNRIVDGSGIKKDPLIEDPSEREARLERHRIADVGSSPYQSKSRYSRYLKLWGISP